jgi:hypothetical protein
MAAAAHGHAAAKPTAQGPSTLFPSLSPSPRGPPASLPPFYAPAEPASKSLPAAAVCRSPETCPAYKGVELGEGSHPRPPTQLPNEVQKRLLSAAFQTYDCKASYCSAPLWHARFLGSAGFFLISHKYPRPLSALCAGRVEQCARCPGLPHTGWGWGRRVSWSVVPRPQGRHCCRMVVRCGVVR